MLKRYQILIEDWLGDHVKEISKKYDISFSEAIRIVLCLQIPKLVKVAYPKCNCVDLDKDMVKSIKQVAKNKMNTANFHKLLSRIYFEAQKSVEDWSREEKKKNRSFV